MKRIPEIVVRAAMKQHLQGIASKGGKARAKKLTPERRREIAREAGKAGGRGRGKK